MAVSAGEHPVDGSRLRPLVLAERDRISRRSRLRELALGIQDGLFISLAVVTGLASANVAKSAVIAGGTAGAVAGALAKGTEAFLESRAEDEL